VGRVQVGCAAAARLLTCGGVVVSLMHQGGVSEGLSSERAADAATGFRPPCAAVGWGASLRRCAVRRLLIGWR